MKETKTKPKTRELDMLQGSILKGVLRFALPLILSGLCQQLFATADTLVLGQFVGDAAMAAVGSNGPTVGMLVNLFLGLSLGANVVIAQAVGGGRMRDAKRAADMSLLLALASGLLLAALGELFTDRALALLAVPQEVYDVSEEYLRIVLLGLPGMALYNFAAANERSCGNGRTPFFALLIASLLNVVLDLAAVLLLSESDRVAGVAWATALTNSLSGLLLAALLRWEKGAIRLDFSTLAWSEESFRAIARIGLPAGIQGVVFSLANLLIQNAINSLGPDAMAASSAAFILELNLYCLIQGLGQTTTTFVGQNYGARNLSRCFLITRQALLLAFSLMLVLGLASWYFEHEILRLFTSDETVIALGAARILYVMAPQCVNSAIEIISGALRGYGNSLPPALIVLLTICGMRVFWLLAVFTKWQTFDVLMMVYPASWGATVLLLILVYIVYRHRLLSSQPALGEAA